MDVVNWALDLIYKFVMIYHCKCVSEHAWYFLSFDLFIYFFQFLQCEGKYKKIVIKQFNNLLILYFYVWLLHRTTIKMKFSCSAFLIATTQCSVFKFQLIKNNSYMKIRRIFVVIVIKDHCFEGTASFFNTLFFWRK